MTHALLTFVGVMGGVLAVVGWVGFCLQKVWDGRGELWFGLAYAIPIALGVSLYTYFTHL